MRYFLIAVLFLLPLAACDGGGGGNGVDDGTREMNNIERTVWNLTVVCFHRSGIEPYASTEYAAPRVKVIGDPCNSPSLGACPRVNENIIEFNDAQYFSDANATPLNIELMVHYMKNILSFQASGMADFANEGIWFDGEPPCTDVGFNQLDLCARTSVDCANPLAPFNSP